MNDNSTSATIAMVLVIVALFVMVAIPPSFVAVGPLSLGDNSIGTCHGVKHDNDIWVEFCK